MKVYAVRHNFWSGSYNIVSLYKTRQGANVKVLQLTGQLDPQSTETQSLEVMKYKVYE